MTDLLTKLAVWEGSFSFAGIKARCFILDDGRKIIHADDMDAIIVALADGARPTADEMQKYRAWCTSEGTA